MATKKEYAAERVWQWLRHLGAGQDNGPGSINRVDYDEGDRLKLVLNEDGGEAREYVLEVVSHRKVDPTEGVVAGEEGDQLVDVPPDAGESL